MTKTFCDVCGRDRAAMFSLVCSPKSDAATALVNSVDNPIGFKQVDICDACLTALTSPATVAAIRTASLGTP